jgi:hypothetical protein
MATRSSAALPLSSKVVSVSDSIPDYAAEIPRTPYANALETHVGQDHINRLTQVFIDIGVAHWLEEHPFSRLELTHAVVYRGQNVNGLYDFLQRTLKIATTRDSSEYGQTFEWQRAYSVSSTGKTPTETVQMTLVHELGHHIHNILGQTHRAYFNAGQTHVEQIGLICILNVQRKSAFVVWNFPETR